MSRLSEDEAPGLLSVQAVALHRSMRAAGIVVHANGRRCSYQGPRSAIERLAPRSRAAEAALAAAVRDRRVCVAEAGRAARVLLPYLLAHRWPEDELFDIGRAERLDVASIKSALRLLACRRYPEPGERDLWVVDLPWPLDPEGRSGDLTRH